MTSAQLRANPATEAWKAILRLIGAERPPRFPAVAHEFELSVQQMRLLQALAPDVELPMNAVAEELHCDASNVTGLVDRLEQRGLIERRPDPADRRVKRLALTEAGADLRAQVLDRLHEPPPHLGRLSRAEQRTLRDLLEKALGE